MFAGIDVASERHMLARLDAQGVPLGKPVPITDDREGYDMLLRLLGPPPVLVAMEATGHYWKNLYAALVATGHSVVLLNPLKTRRFQDSALERTKTDAIDATGVARFAFEKRPEVTQLHDAAAEALRELGETRWVCAWVRHRDRIRQDFDDRVRQLHRLVDLSFPEFTRYVRGLDSMLATALLSECPTAHDFARATPKRLAKLRYDGRHLVGAERATQLIEAAKRSIGQHHGPAYRLQAHHICQNLDLWRRRLVEIERDIDGLLESNEVGQLLLSVEPRGSPDIDGIGPQTAARIVEPRGSPDIAAVGDPARFESAAAFAAYVGVVPGLKQSGKNAGRRAACAPMGNARLRRALWMPVVGAVRRNAWLKQFYDGLIARGKPPKLALIAAMRKLLHAAYSVAKNRKPFTSKLTKP